MSETVLSEAAMLYRNGNLEGAATLYSTLLPANTTNFVPYYMLGIIRAQQGRYGEALQLIDNALRLNPTHPTILSGRANVLNALGRAQEALESCARALEIDPLSMEAAIARGNALFGLKRYSDAVNSCDVALAHFPNNAKLWGNRGIALRALHQLETAIDSFDRAIAINPQNMKMVIHLANTFLDLQRFDEALANYETALSIAPKLTDGWIGRGQALLALYRLSDASASFAKALAINPRLADALIGQGMVSFRRGAFQDALHWYEAALAENADYVPALANRGNALRASGQFKEALASFERALAIDGDDMVAFSGAATMALTLCDWTRTDKIATEIQAKVSSKLSISPFTVLGYSDDNVIILQNARNTVNQAVKLAFKPLWKDATYKNDKIRVAYLSSNFSQHPVALQIAQLIELHDRSKFEVYGISTGRDDGSQIRQRLFRAFDNVIEANGQTDLYIADCLLRESIDILVDLNGHTQGARLGVLAYRACPVQLSWLGYPGTLGSDFIDYLLVDRIVVPPSDCDFYTEKLYYLPDTYFVADSTRIVPPPPSRVEVNLPQEAFVFCCFNATWKITRPIFEIWMRVLRNVPGSVLWLKDCPLEAKRNLTREASLCGVSVERIIFAKEVELPTHLARHALADLFLDTLPFNAHATASDALWGKLPVLTCSGKSFAGRVCSSLLHSLDLPDLIAKDILDYEDMAVELARNPTKMRSLKDKLERGIRSAALFDVERFRKNIETAFIAMLDARR